MSIKTQQKKKEWDVHDYGKRISQIMQKAKSELSKRNYQLLVDCDKSMVRIATSKAA